MWVKEIEIIFIWKDEEKKENTHKRERERICA